MNTTTQAAPAPNKPTFEQLLITAEELGGQEAQGKDVQIKFDMKVLEAAYLGAVDNLANKHGMGIDDATRLAAAYVKGRNKAVIFDHKEPKQRKLCSTVRVMVKLGGSPKWGVGEPMQNVNTLVTERQNLRRTGAKGVKLEEAHAMLLRYARDQLKRDQLITGDELKSYCFKQDADPRTVTGWLKKVIKDATSLQTGKLSNCHESDNSRELDAILANAQRRLNALQAPATPKAV